MKKMFTLLLLAGIVSVAQAQQTEERSNVYDSDDNGATYDRRGNGNSTNRNNNPFVWLERERDRDMARINREYDRKIQRVYNSYFSNRFQKQRMIRQLEDERRMELRQVQMEYQRKLNRIRRNGNNRHF
jgi:hypothetical protein